MNGMCTCQFRAADSLHQFRPARDGGNTSLGAKARFHNPFVIHQQRQPQYVSARRILQLHAHGGILEIADSARIFEVIEQLR